MILRRLSLAFLVGILSARNGMAQVPNGPGAGAAVAPPRAFIENHGQWSNGALFQMRRGNSVVAVRPDGFTIQMLRIDGSVRDREWDGHEIPVAVDGWNLTLRFRGASRDAVVQGVEELPGVYNYLRGSDASTWVTGVHGYARVRIAGLYHGIDLELYERNGVLEYDIVLFSGANASDIVIDVLGSTGIDAGAHGGLVLHSPWQGFEHSGAICLIEADGSGSAAAVASYRSLSAISFAVDVSGWDSKRQLIIDPTVLYSTCLGGSGTEEPYAVAARNGTVVVGGDTLSLDFPLTPGAFQSIQMGLGDAYVTSLAADGTSLIYSTLLGGATQDLVEDVAIAPDGLAIVAGTAGSGAGFPVTPGAFDVTQSSVDGFLAKVAADGGSLVFSTLIGGSDIDPSTRVVAAPDGTFYVAGLTESSDFPTTPNAFASALQANVAAYVARFSADGSQLLASTLLGGTGRTKGRGLGLDAEGNVYVAGYASGNPNTPIPVTPGAFDTIANGEVDAFVAKFNPDLSSLIYCTYLGGAFFDEAWGLAIDAEGAAYVTGITDSFAFPTTPGALDTSLNGSQDAFVTQLDPTGSSLEFSTYLGGGGTTDADDVAVGPSGSVFVAGDLNQFDDLFPFTPDSWDAEMSGTDAYLVQLDPTGTIATYSTMIGGSGLEEGRAMCLDEHGDAFVAGEAFSSDFPTTPGAFDPTMTDFKDSFVVRFSFGPWTGLGGALKGTGGIAPWLSAWGTLEPGSAGELSVLAAAPGKPATLVLGLSQFDAPFKGGTLVPAPLVLLALVTDASGEVQLGWPSWPSGIPAGTEFYVQAWVADAGGSKGYAASQALKAVTP